MKNRIVSGGVGSLLTKALHACLTFSISVILARWLGPSDYGIYVFSLAVIMMLSIPTQIGLPQLITRETAKAADSNNFGIIKGIWKWSNRAAFISAIVVLLALWVSLTIFKNSPRAETIAIGSLLIPLIAFTNIRSAMLRGLKRIFFGLLPENVIRPSLLLIFVACMSIFPLEFGFQAPIYVMAAHAIAALISFIFASFFLLRVGAPYQTSSTEIVNGRAWIGSVLPLALVASVHLINTQADLIMLGYMEGNGAAGIYRTASQLALLIPFGLQAINQMLQPHIASIHNSGNPEALEKLLKKSNTISLFLAAPPLLLFLFFGDDIIRTVFGEEYISATSALMILSIGQFFNAAIGSVGQVLNMSGFERDTLKGVTLAAVFNILFNAALIPQFGIAGAAASTAISTMVWNCSLAYFVRKRLGINLFLAVVPTRK